MIRDEDRGGEMPGKQSAEKEQSAMVPYLRPANIPEKGEKERAEMAIDEKRDEKRENARVPEAHLDIESASHVWSIAREELRGREEESGDI